MRIMSWYRDGDSVMVGNDDLAWIQMKSEDTNEIRIKRNILQVLVKTLN